MSITRHSIQIDSQGVKQTEAELRALDAADKRVESSLNDVASAANKASASVTKVGAASQSAAKSSSGAVDSIRSGFEKLDGTVSKVMGVTNTLGDVFKLVGMGVGVGALVGGFADIVEVGSKLIDVFDKTGERLQAQVVYYQSLTQSIDAARQAAADLRSEQEKAFSAAYVAGLTNSGSGTQAGLLAAQIEGKKNLLAEYTAYIAEVELGGTTAAASGFMSREQQAKLANARLQRQLARDKLEARQKAAGLDRLYLDQPPDGAGDLREEWNARTTGRQGRPRDPWVWDDFSADAAAIRQKDLEIKELEGLTMTLSQVEDAARELAGSMKRDDAELKSRTEEEKKKTPTKPETEEKAKTDPESLTYLYDNLLGGFGSGIKDAFMGVVQVARDFKDTLEAQIPQTRWLIRVDKAVSDIVDADMAAVAHSDLPNWKAAYTKAKTAAEARAHMETEAGIKDPEMHPGMVALLRGRKSAAMVTMEQSASIDLQKALDEGLMSRAQTRSEMAPMIEALAADDLVATHKALVQIKDTIHELELSSGSAWENMVDGLRFLGRELAAEASNISGIIASTVGALTNGIGSMMTNLIVAGEAGWSNIKKTIGNALAGISAQAFGYSVLLGALGTASAVGIIGLPAAPGLFAAAGVMFGAGVTLAGMARGFGADQIGASPSGAAAGGKSGGTQFNGLSPTKPNDQPINVTVVLSDEGVYDGMVRVDRRRAMSGSSRPRMAGAF